MKTRSDQHLFRLAATLCAGAMVVAYGVMIPLKVADRLPEKMSWGKVIVGPMVFVGYLVAFRFAQWWDSRKAHSSGGK